MWAIEEVCPVIGGGATGREVVAIRLSLLDTTFPGGCIAGLKRAEGGCGVRFSSCGGSLEPAVTFSNVGSCGTGTVDEAIVKGDNRGGGAGPELAVEDDADWLEAAAAACCIWTSCLCNSANWNINKQTDYHNCMCYFTFAYEI